MRFFENQKYTNVLPNTRRQMQSNDQFSKIGQ